MFDRRKIKRSGEGSPGWWWRRSVVIPLIVYACYRLTMLELAADTRVNESLAWWWGVIIISNVFFYTGFATAQDIAAIMATRSGMPYDPSAAPPQYYQRTETVAPVDPSQPATTTTTTTTQQPLPVDPQPPAGYAG